ncbi:MAG TPA: ankyrin repeat domain-containing protein [Chthonomonadales bacterium]|nr:ankyrin repeat domain-containing protein [Chthonomonadales bacterium]
MSDALPLPPHPSIAQYRKRAKELAGICKAGSEDGLRRFTSGWIETLVKHYGLHVEPGRGQRPYTDAEIAHLSDRTLSRITKHLGGSNLTGVTLSRAQFAIAREHGFASWPRFAGHLAMAALPESLVSRFEAAADAIVGGELTELQRLLGEHPALVRARSTREHRSTLLHYVAANGIEDFRQKTPGNIVQIARFLVKHGADVNAESNAYGGGSTALTLAATSVHPEAAGVQLALLELLIDYGATIDPENSGSTVNACLHNGRGRAALFLAGKGARLDLEGAAGTGRTDVVRGFFPDGIGPTPPATREQMQAGFGWACEFGHTAVVDYLLQVAVPVDLSLGHGGQTGLHWAAYAGDARIVRRLLDHGAQVDARDLHFHGNPLEWALYAWGNRTAGKEDSAGYYQVVSLLVSAGASLDPEWLTRNEDRKRAARKLQSDSQMQSALSGAIGL